MRVQKQPLACGWYAGTRLAAMAAATAVLALSGCISMAPPYEAPALPVAQHYDADDGRDGLSAAAVGWQAYFTAIVGVIVLGHGQRGGFVRRRH